MVLEQVCISLAKDSFRRGQHVLAPDGSRLSAAERKAFHEISTRRELCNGVVRFSADEGQLGKAERWMQKLDGKNGCAPDIGAFNALLLAAARAGDLTKAEEWFAKLDAVGLHPELVGLEKNMQSYDIMIEASAWLGDIARAEKYLAAAQADLNQRPSLASQCALVRACIDKGEPRRAHRWMEVLTRNGCHVRPCYEARVVKLERMELRSQRTWDVDSYTLLVISLVQGLANTGNSITANTWLQYLSNSGLRYDDAPEVWEHVRESHPPEIVPAVLSFESSQLASPRSPMFKRPATLSGERRGSKLVADTGRFVLQDASGSSRGPSPWPIEGDSYYGSAAASPVPSRVASPSLRKVLDVKSRGATPTTSRFSASSLPATASIGVH